MVNFCYGTPYSGINAVDLPTTDETAEGQDVTTESESEGTND
jgi:hypothetical protein